MKEGHAVLVYVRGMRVRDSGVCGPARGGGCDVGTNVGGAGDSRNIAGVQRTVTGSL